MQAGSVLGLNTCFKCVCLDCFCSYVKFPIFPSPVGPIVLSTWDICDRTGRLFPSHYYGTTVFSSTKVLPAWLQVAVSLWPLICLQFVCCSAWAKLNTKIGLSHHQTTHHTTPPPQTFRPVAGIVGNWNSVHSFRITERERKIPPPLSAQLSKNKAEHYSTPACCYFW